MPRVAWVLVGLVFVVAAIALFVRWLEPRASFFPAAGESDTPADLGVAFDADTIATADGERLHAWRIHAGSPRALIVYFHGNGGNLSIWTPIVVQPAQHGYETVAFDYRGYGLSTGRPSETGLQRDVDALLARIDAWRRPDQPVVYWGRSIGTAMAAYAATRRAPDGIILEAGFPEARALVRRSLPLRFLALFATYRFATAATMRSVRAPALVIHGDADSVVPFALGQELFEQVNEPKTFLRVAGGDHNDTTPPDARTYWEAVNRFVSTLRAPGEARP